MSDLLPSVVDESLFDELLWSDDDLYRNQQWSTVGKKYNSVVLPEDGTSWQGREACVAISMTESVETQSDSVVDIGKVQDWVNGIKLPNMRMKRKQIGVLPEVQEAPANHITRERQRGKNWEKAEEDILVELKGKGMNWKSISECLTSKGFIRDHRHCSDKWYALRKHYIEIQQWMVQSPGTNYWDLTDSERIRTVPSSFCQKWYQIFDAVRQKPGESRKRVQQSLKPRRISDYSGQYLAATDPSPSHFKPAMSGVALDSLPSSDPAFRIAHPSCQPSVPQKDSQRHHSRDRFYAGDAIYESERHEAMVEYSNLSCSNIGVLWAEIRELSHTLRQKFAAEEEERMRNMKIKEQKLQLKIERFHYKRERDEELRKRPDFIPKA